MNSTPNWKLRRLAARALRVLERRAEQDLAIAAYAITFKPRAEEFIKMYDATARYRSEWLREMEEGREVRFDAHACRRYQNGVKESTGYSVCGMCVYSCPYGQK